MTIFGSFNNYIDELLGLEKPISVDERQIIGMEVSNALSAVKTLAAHYSSFPTEANTAIGKHIEMVLMISFDGDITYFELARFVDPKMPVMDFIAGVGEAFHLWPYLLTRSNRPSRRLFSYTVKDALFKNNDVGWQGYVDRMRNQGLGWFGREEEE
jgi:hypothetical protein